MTRPRTEAAFIVCRNPIPVLGHLAPLPGHVCELPAGFGVNSLAGAQLALRRFQAIFVRFGCHNLASLQLDDERTSETVVPPN
jgi:hypothetical protein